MSASARVRSKTALLETVNAMVLSLEKKFNVFKVIVASYWYFGSNFGHLDPFIGARGCAAGSAAGTVACSASFGAIVIFLVLCKDFVRTTKLFIFYVLLSRRRYSQQHGDIHFLVSFFLPTSGAELGRSKMALGPWVGSVNRFDVKPEENPQLWHKLYSSVFIMLLSTYYSSHDVWYGFIYLFTFSSNTINSLWPTKVTLALNMIDVDENCCIIFIATLYFPSDSLDFRNSNGNILRI
ncbi:hypothetical protein P8452_41413 [Trifolium repens]|nr:hypothetical protein P8452_41413 [Trifolium repens]